MNDVKEVMSISEDFDKQKYQEILTEAISNTINDIRSVLCYISYY